MKITITNNVTQRPYTLGLSHHGVHLKRKYGGPPWWRYLNGLRLNLKNSIIWIEFYHSYRRGRFFMNLRKSYKR